MKIAGTLRAVPGGLGVAGMEVNVYLHSAPTVPLNPAPLITDANGRWSYQQNGNPGPWFWKATNTEPATDVVRSGSSKSYGSGGSYSLAELPVALRARGHGYVPGYLSGFAPVTLASGVTLDVPSGAVLALGVPAVWYDPSTYAVLAARDAANSRLGYLGVRVNGPDHPTEPGRAVLAEEVGTAAASPALPALGPVQTESSYFVPLWSFRLRPTGISPAIDTLADVRPNPNARQPIVATVVRRLATDPPATTTSTGAVDAVGLTTFLALAAGVTYDISGRVWVVSKVDAVSTTGQIAVFLDGSPNIGPFVGHASTSDLGLANVHTVEGRVGTGSATQFGARVKVAPGGQMTYGVGYFQVVARPRT